jgi:hypothetical protein
LSRSRSLIAVLAALAGLLVCAAGASAKDRNHDRIPDRWEKRHHLSLHHNQAHRDQDKDGLRNRAEWRSGTDPRDDDSDGDGVEDGDENAGTIVSFADGVLKISVFGQSDPLVGLVDDSTEIECESARATASSDDEPGDDHGDEPGGDHGDDEQGDDDDQGEDEDDFDEASCGTDQLTAGTKVKEAELRLRDGKAVFEELELHP